jgi:hypothetical protein
VAVIGGGCLELWTMFLFFLLTKKQIIERKEKEKTGVCVIREKYNPVCIKPKHKKVK